MTYAYDSHAVIADTVRACYQLKVTRCFRFPMLQNSPGVDTTATHSAGKLTVGVQAGRNESIADVSKRCQRIENCLCFNPHAQADTAKKPRLVSRNQMSWPECPRNRWPMRRVSQVGRF